MKMTLIAVAAFAAAALAGAAQASAMDSHSGVTVGRPNGYQQVGSNSSDRRHGYDWNRSGRPHAQPHDQYLRGCLAPRQIQHRLSRHGWRDFHVVDTSRRSLIVTAKRGRGPHYRLKLDRCNGAILEARQIGGRHHHDGHRGRGRT